MRCVQCWNSLYLYGILVHNNTLVLSMPKKITTNTLMGDAIMEWTVREYDQHNRGTLWHVLIISIGFYNYYLVADLYNKC